MIEKSVGSFRCIRERGALMCASVCVCVGLVCDCVCVSIMVWEWNVKWVWLCSEPLTPRACHLLCPNETFWSFNEAWSWHQRSRLLFRQHQRRTATTAGGRHRSPPYIGLFTWQLFPPPVAGLKWLTATHPPDPKWTSHVYMHITIIHTDTHILKKTHARVHDVITS